MSQLTGVIANGKTRKPDAKANARQQRLYELKALVKKSAANQRKKVKKHPKTVSLGVTTIV